MWRAKTSCLATDQSSPHHHLGALHHQAVCHLYTYSPAARPPPASFCSSHSPSSTCCSSTFTSLLPSVGLLGLAKHLDHLHLFHQPTYIFSSSLYHLASTTTLSVNIVDNLTLDYNPLESTNRTRERRLPRSLSLIATLLRIPTTQALWLNSGLTSSA